MSDGTEWLEITPDERAAMHRCFDLTDELALLLEEQPMRCFYKMNPYSGHAPSHKRLCAYADCGEDATRHVSTTGWCGNCCLKCSDRLLKTHARAEVTEGIYLAEGAQV